jgi:hypothetical protein
MYGNFRMTAAADMVRTVWARARSHAMAEGTAYRFSVVPGKGNFRLAPDSGAFWDGDGTPTAPPDPTQKPLVLEGALPKGVRFRTPEGGGDANDGGNSILPPGGAPPSAYKGKVVFLPDGSAREDAELILSARGVKGLVIRLRGLTGAVTTRAQ